MDAKKTAVKLNRRKWNTRGSNDNGRGRPNDASFYSDRPYAQPISSLSNASTAPATTSTIESIYIWRTAGMFENFISFNPPDKVCKSRPPQQVNPSKLRWWMSSENEYTVYDGINSELVRTDGPVGWVYFADLEKSEETKSEDSDDFICFESNDPGSEKNTKVKFSLPPQVRVIRTWRHDHRRERNDFWQQIGRDHARFNRKITEIRPNIETVLDAGHRQRIWNERFAN